MIDDKVIRRFTAKVNKGRGCWEWQGSLRSGDYGSFTIQGKRERAHRVAWIIAHGPIPDGLCVCHKCDNPKCVRPDHLWLGTQLENVEDKVSKNRQRGRPRSPIRLCTVEGCAGRAYANNLYCQCCTRRYQRYSDPTIVHQRGRKKRG